MAFTTEFVMGAGGAEVEEIPVSVSGSGNGTVHPLTTVDAGGGAWVWADGTKSGSANASLNVESRSYHALYGSPRMGGGGYFTGTVPVSMTTLQPTLSASFTGIVYVIRV